MPKTGDTREDGFRWGGKWRSPEAHQRKRAGELIRGRRREALMDKGEPGVRSGHIRTKPCWGTPRGDGFRRISSGWLSPEAFKRERARLLINTRRRIAMRKGMDVSGLETKGPHYRELQEIIMHGKSILSGIPFNHEGGLTWDSPSIDQKVAGKGYAWENIRVVLMAENSAMGTWGKDIAMYVFAKCLLREAEKRGDAETTLAILRELANRYKPEGQ